MVNFLIRRLEERDRKDFIKCYSEIFPEKPIAEKIWENLPREPAMVWVAEDTMASAVVGFLYVWVVADEVQIIDVGVLPKCRRQGLARGLLTALVGESQLFAKTMHLEVRSGNFAAQRLYEEFGFKFVRIRKKYYSDGEDASLYRRNDGS